MVNSQDVLAKVNWACHLWRLFARRTSWAMCASAIFGDVPRTRYDSEQRRPFWQTEGRDWRFTFLFSHANCLSSHVSLWFILLWGNSVIMLTFAWLRNQELQAHRYCSTGTCGIHTKGGYNDNDNDYSTRDGIRIRPATGSTLWLLFYCVDGITTTTNTAATATSINQKVHRQGKGKGKERYYYVMMEICGSNRSSWVLGVGTGCCDNDNLSDQWMNSISHWWRQGYHFAAGVLTSWQRPTFGLFGLFHRHFNFSINYRFPLSLRATYLRFRWLFLLFSTLADCQLPIAIKNGRWPIADCRLQKERIQKFQHFCFTFHKYE